MSNIPSILVGFGYDIHRLERGKRLVLCGVEIESDYGTIAHSDGDVALHALTDAILGAIGGGDIGELFPDTDPANAGRASRDFVEKAISLANEKRYELVNIDITIVLEKPKILPFKPVMLAMLSHITQLPRERCSVKATTNESVGFIGRGEGVAAMVSCLLSAIE